MSDESATSPGEGAGYRFSAGTVLAGRYRVQVPLGRGGMSEVYQVEDTQLGEVVALKALGERLLASPVALSRFQGEVKNARRIAHPNVCRTHEFGVHGEGPEAVHFLTMELLAGETLDDRLTRGPMGRAELVEVLGQVAAAIDAAHEVGVIHRDLKPSNVMLVARSGGGTRAVVTDFGLARRVEESRLTTQESWVGTPAYVAPEQLEGDAGGPAVDVYAFGVVLFQAITGRLPFEGGTGPQVALQRLARPAPRLRTIDPTLPAAWDEAVARCLDRRPEDRWAHASDALHAMEPGAAAGWSGARPPAPRRRSLRRLALPALLVAAVAAAAGALGWWRLAKGALPATGRVLAVKVATASGVAAPVMPDGFPPFNEAAAYVLRKEWTRLEEPRRFRVSADETGNVTARVEWALRGPAIAGTVVLAAGGRTVARFEAEAPSVRELAAALYPAIARVLGQGQAESELFPEEREEMRLWGAPDATAFKSLKRAVVENWSELSIEGSVLDELAALVRRYPRWPHTALAVIAGKPAEANRLAAEQLPVASEGDAAGRELLGLLAKQRLSELNAGASFERWWSRHDLVIDTLLAWPEGTQDEVNARYVLLAERYPDLQWTGLSPTLVDGQPDWRFRAPGNRQAWLFTMAGKALGEAPDPLGGLPWFRRLHGDPPQTRVPIAAVHLARFDLEAVRAMAPSLLATSPLTRAQAQFLLAQESVFSGRLRAARDKHLRAWDTYGELKAGGTNLPLVQASRELMQLETLLGDAAAANRHRAQLVEDWRTYHWPTSVLPALRWEMERARTGACPPPSWLPGTTTDVDGREAARLVHRAAAAAGCGPCEAVVADGPSLNEEVLPWTATYARCAVEQGRGLEEALRMLRSGERYASLSIVSNQIDPSAVDVVLSHYWRGRVLEKQGKGAEAKAAYERFLKFWGQADIPIPEVDDARKRLAGLK